jgi:putative DNA primase/helicase
MAKQAKRMDGGYQKGENRGGKILNTYLYQDEHGKDYHMVERTEHHQFPQRHWGIVDDDTGKEGWLPGAPAVKIPYQLPELLEHKAKHPDEPIFVTEGEKDADTVTKMELTTTTNSAGAGKWDRTLNKWFKGFKCAYVLEDNDEDGYHHAATVSRNLLDAGVEKVYIVHFYDLKEKQDVTDWVKEYGGDKAKLLRRCQNAELVKDLPIISIKQENIPHAAKLLEQALLASKQPLLSRGGQLVQPIYQHWENDIKGKKRTTQTTELHAVDEITLHYIARKHACQFSKWDGRAKKEVFCPPTTPLLQMVIANRHGPFPKVRGCINAPTLRPDGSILSEPGYDKATGLWHYRHDAAALPDDMPKKPTKADAVKALALLKNLYKEVPFWDATLDPAIAVAALLTAVCRGAYTTAPMFLFSAPKSGTGKSYMVDVISHIVQGTWCNVINLAGPKEEREKRIGAVLLNGTNMISMDNLENDLNDIVLNQMLTQPTVSVRVLSKSEIVKCEWRGTIFATGNNVQLVGDLIRRGLTCHLNAKMESPEKRQFKWDPIEDVMENRGKYIAACFTIARAYHFTKGIKRLPPLVSFEGWSHFVKDSLIWLGEPDILAAMDAAKKKDPHVRAAEELVAVWAEGKVLKVNTPYRVTEIIKLAMDTMQSSPLQDLLLAQAAANGGRGTVDPRRLGWWLKMLADQVHLGHVITVAKESKNGHSWILQAIAGG